MSENWKCNECRKICPTERGLFMHYAQKHKDVFRIRFPKKEHIKETPDYDFDTLEELEKTSIINFMRFLDGDLSQISGRKRRRLCKDGIIKSKPGKNGGIRFTQKGLEIMRMI